MIQLLILYHPNIITKLHNLCCLSLKFTNLSSLPESIINLTNIRKPFLDKYILPPHIERYSHWIKSGKTIYYDEFHETLIKSANKRHKI